MYLTNSNQTWIERGKPLSQQFEKISVFKTKAKAKEFLTPDTMFMYPIIKYAYSLQFDQKPDYN
jgi:hypothetical protein